MKYVRKTSSPSRMKAFVPCHSSTPKSRSKSSVIVYHGICSQPIRAFQSRMSACGARETNTSVVSRALRCARFATWSARNEQPGPAALGEARDAGLVEEAVDDELAAAVE